MSSAGMTTMTSAMDPSVMRPPKFLELGVVIVTKRVYSQVMETTTATTGTYSGTEGTFSVINSEGTKIRTWVTTEAKARIWFANATGVGPYRVSLVGPTGKVLA